MVDIGTLPGGSYSQAIGVNDSGQVVGVSTTADGSTHAFSWTQTGGLVDIGTLSGDTYSQPKAVNRGGQVAGFSFGPSGSRAFLWTEAGGIVDLGSVGGGNDSQVYGLSDSGQVVGYGYVGDHTCPHPFTWTASTGMVDLGAADPPDPMGAGGTCGYAYAVNNLGDVAGAATVGLGVTHAVLWNTAPNDHDPPRVACDSSDGAWHKDNVAISCTASDEGSGLADSSDASFTLHTSVAHGSEDPNAATDSHQVCDNAGNCTTAGPVAGNKIDRKAPTTSCDLADGQWHHDNVAISCTGSDSEAAQITPAFSFYEDAGINSPQSITAGPDNALWFTEAGYGAIGRITTAGSISFYRDPRINSPTSIATGPDGALWFTNLGYGTIGRITTGGSMSFYADPRVNAPVSITTGPDGALWFTDPGYGQIGRVTTEGSFSIYTDPRINGPGPITRGPDGALWFTNGGYGSIGRITTTGALSFYSDPGLNYPAAITPGPDGALWFTDRGYGQIGRITTEGSISLYSGFNLSSPVSPFDFSTAIITGPDEALWFAGGDGMGRLTTDGARTSYQDPRIAGIGSITTGPDAALWFTNGSSIGRLATAEGGATSNASGLANPEDARFSMTTSVAQGSEDPNAATDSHQVCDNAGNCTTAGPVAGNKIDRKAPTTSCDSADGQWHNDNVAISCPASDEGSGLADSSDASSTLHTSVADGSEDSNAATDDHQVCDNAGNCTTAGPVAGNKIDRKAPSLSFSQRPNGQNGWFKSGPATTHVDARDSQIASLDCKLDGQDISGQPDSGSGSRARDVSTSSEGRHSVDCTASDVAANSTSASDQLRLDVSVPTAPSAATDRQPDYASDWFKDRVTVSFADNGDPDLADGTRGSGVGPASVPAPVMKTQSGRYDIAGAVEDLAGNSSPQTTETVRVDADAPTVKITCPQTPVLLGSAATATVTASDGDSGLAQDPSGTPALNTSSVGMRSASATATDNVGHSASDSCSYQVIFDYSSPLASPPAVISDNASKKQTFEFSLRGNQGLGVLAAGYPTQRPIDCATHAATGAAQPISISLRYDAKKDLYSFDWTPGKALAGSCREVAMRLVDGTTHRVWFSFK